MVLNSNRILNLEEESENGEDKSLKPTVHFEKVSFRVCVVACKMTELLALGFVNSN